MGKPSSSIQRRKWNAGKWAPRGHQANVISTCARCTPRPPNLWPPQRSLRTKKQGISMTSPRIPAASWQQRFRVPQVGWTRLATAQPTRGLVASNQSGCYQLYAWDVPTGTLTQLTEAATGVGNGYITPDGSWVYYLKDQRGNERGHLVRVPFGGG